MRTTVRIRVAVAVTLAVVLVLGFLAFALGLVGIGSATSMSSIPDACPQVREEPRPQPFFSNARRHPVPFTATAALLCLYTQEPSAADPGGYAERFSRQLVLSEPATADALATELNAGSRRGAVFTVHGCGADTGERVAAYFRGGASQAVEVVISAGGCATAANGGNVSSIADSQIVPDVLALFGCRFPRPDAAPPNLYCGL